MSLSDAVQAMEVKQDIAAQTRLSDSVFARYSKGLDCVILSQGEDVMVLKWADFETMKTMMHTARKEHKGY